MKNNRRKVENSQISRLSGWAARIFIGIFYFYVCIWRQNLNLIVFSISILDPPKSKNVFLDAHYIPRVSNDTREKREPSAVSLDEADEGWRGRGEGSGGWQWAEWAESAIRGRARARALITRDGWPGPGMGRCAGRPGRFSPIIVVMWLLFYILYIH